MKLNFDAPKGRRIKSGRGRFIWAKPMRPARPWYSPELGQWLKMEDVPEGMWDISNCYGPIRSVRAFRRKLKQWAKDNPDTEFVLVSRYRGCDVVGRTKK